MIESGTPPLSWGQEMGGMCVRHTLAQRSQVVVVGLDFVCPYKGEFCVAVISWTVANTKQKTKKIWLFVTPSRKKKEALG